MALAYVPMKFSPGGKPPYLIGSLRIVRITGGECLWQIGERKLHFAAGQLVLLNDRIPRHILDSNGLQLDIFAFRSQDISAFPLLLHTFYGESPRYCRESQTVGRLLELLRDTLTAGQEETAKYLFHGACSLLEKEFPERTEQRAAKIAFAAADYIMEHFREDISVPLIARELSISKNHLENCFRQLHGIGVGGYIRMIRLHNAEKMLRKELNRSVLDIALSCGFRSSAGFYKAYRAFYGTPPRKNG